MGKRRKEQINGTMKDLKCYSNTRLEQATVTTVHSSALSWLLVTMIRLQQWKKKKGIGEFHWLLLYCAEVVVVAFFTALAHDSSCQ